MLTLFCIEYISLHKNTMHLTALHFSGQLCLWLIDWSKADNKPSLSNAQYNTHKNVEKSSASWNDNVYNIWVEVLYFTIWVTESTSLMSRRSPIFLFLFSQLLLFRCCSSFNRKCIFYCASNMIPSPINAFFLIYAFWLHRFIVKKSDISLNSNSSFHTNDQISVFFVPLQRRTEIKCWSEAF